MLSVSVVLQASGERAAVVDAAAAGPPTTRRLLRPGFRCIVSGHLGWPAGVGYRVVGAYAARRGSVGANVHVDSLTGLCSQERE